MNLPDELTITICPGSTKNGTPEVFEPIVISPGDTISVVGPTGSGKTALINDIEVLGNCGEYARHSAPVGNFEGNGL